ncbi:MAG: dihydrofolate reductase family protein [Leptospirales bacterium]|nr:dihydrofolate reductase family protein [Leptospirales bacterium]
MQTALQELARQSLLAMGRSAPNPPVAAVVLERCGRSWSQAAAGATEPPGSRHAEIVALDRLTAHRPPFGAEPDALRMYVTLEPCTHTGRTPPCTRRILATDALHTLRAGCRDASLAISGIEQLQSAGRRAAIWPPLARLADDFLAGFVSRSSGQGPRLHLKAAIDSAGRMGRRSARQRISGPAATAFVHALRSRMDAVVVGPGTIVYDRPQLNVRSADAEALSQAAEGARSGRDWLSASIVAHCAMLLQSPLQQPRRFFLLGDFFQDAAVWLRMQAALPGPAPHYALLENGDRRWLTLAADCSTLPAVRDAQFPAALRSWLTAAGCNDALIECGPGLLRALRPSMQRCDRLLLLESRLVADPGPEADAIYAPREMLEGLRRFADVRWREDELSLWHVAD